MQISGGVVLSGGVNLAPGSGGSGGSGGFQGSNYGYASGGGNPSIGAFLNNIDKFSFASDGNATDVGDLTQVKKSCSGQSSSASGYTSGGRGGSPVAVLIRIEKFPFTADTNASTVGDLTGTERKETAGQSSSVSGYTSGGPNVNIIDKFPFSSDSNASDVGDLVYIKVLQAGVSSTDHGYNCGGSNQAAPPTNLNIIEKFPFASDDNSTDVGDLLQSSNHSGAGQCSVQSGYVSGGVYATPEFNPSSPTNVIQKFPFASDGTATDVGDLTSARDSVSGQSSTASGYTSGGRDSYGSSYFDIIDKFPFASDSNATDVGNLSVTRAWVAGQQY